MIVEDRKDHQDRQDQRDHQDQLDHLDQKDHEVDDDVCVDRLLYTNVLIQQACLVILVVQMAYLAS